MEEGPSPLPSGAADPKLSARHSSEPLHHQRGVGQMEVHSATANRHTLGLWKVWGSDQVQINLLLPAEQGPRWALCNYVGSTRAYT